MASQLAHTYAGYKPSSEELSEAEMELGLYLNMPRVIANEKLAMIESIGLAISQDANSIGNLLLKSGVGLNEASKIVMAIKVAQVQQKAQLKA